ncbi:MAG: pectin acetylesterase-family hydrolase [Pseudohongiellaceae bacterium]
MNKIRHFILAAFFLCAHGVSAQTSLPSVADLDPGWNRIATDGVCTSGPPYFFYARSSKESDNLLIYFNGGGACWFGEACDLSSEPGIHYPFAAMDENNPGFASGIFELDNENNPLRDYDMVSIPYCTGDVHLGAGERRYTYVGQDGEPVIVTTHHNGFSNSRTVLNWVYETFTNPSSIVVAGSSAGAIGASFYSGLIAEQYADTPTVLVADAAGGYGSPNLPVAFRAWNTAAILPDWPEYSGETNDTLSFEDFYIASANHNPNLTIAQYNAANDETQISFTLLLGDEPGSFSLPLRMLNHYVEIESEVDDFFSYTAGGDVHTILTRPIFYDYEVEAIAFTDWLDALVNGQTPGDVSCVNEVAGCLQAPASGL